MTRRVHAPHTHRHGFGWLLVGLLALGVLGALLVLVMLRVAP